ncbi:hypothetical protein C4K27_3494 [Pseudomonas chlororaphis subsp. chlororaphis]|nr:hypothetical protein C4K27_3494 [Pseudomonas chlororaphis subsp. chlororaphis]
MRRGEAGRAAPAGPISLLDQAIGAKDRQFGKNCLPAGKAGTISFPGRRLTTLAAGAPLSRTHSCSH